jgi:hypothetical protein
MSNQQLTVTELDFDTIKNNLKNFLRSQSEFQDYDFEGSGLNILLDILAYNTHYNAYYLNMVANESFLDSASLRDSVVSHAKTLGYTPFSVSSSRATINLTFSGASTTDTTLSLRRGFSFKTSLVDNRSFNFVVLNETTVTKANNEFYFENLEINEGELLVYNFVCDEQTNPKYIFTIPETNIDTETITVKVRDSLSNTSSEVYELVNDVTEVTPDSKIFYLQEGRNNRYQIYFGDNILGKRPKNQSIVTVEYLVTNGPDANKISNFVVADTVDTDFNSYSYTLQTVQESSGGSLRETVDSIKKLAPTQFTSQDRLVAISDYESYIIRKYPKLDSISVWGGEEESPPIYGKVFISLKPTDGYFISESEKDRILKDIIKPKSIITIRNEFRDPEYLYLNFSIKVQYDPKKTISTSEALKTSIRQSVFFYKNENLNKFKSKFAISKFQEAIDNTDVNSILGSETILRAQKRFLPTLNATNNYVLDFDAAITQGTPINKVSSSEFDVLDADNIRRTVFIEEIPKSSTGINSIDILDSGSGYTTEPTVTIVGDGFGATARAIVEFGRIQSIVITNPGIDYNRATVVISGGNGFGASAQAVIDNSIGKLRAVYYTSSAERVVVIPDLGEINYLSGVITLNDLNILSSSTSDGYVRVNCGLQDNIIQSNRNTILTIDENDSSAIGITLIPI